MDDQEAHNKLKNILGWALKNGAIEKIKRLPSAESLTWAEPRIKAIHAQAYWNLVFNFNITAIHNIVILLELFLKDLWFSKYRIDSTKDLASLIDICSEQRILTNEEKNFCKKIETRYRNLYLHGNYGKLTEGASVMGVAIPVDETNIEKTIERMEYASKTPIDAQENSRRYTPKDLPALKDILTLQRADAEAEPLFLKVDEFIRKKSKAVHGNLEKGA